MKRWPLRSAYFWETAPFFRILLPFVAGIICYDLIPVRHTAIDLPFTIIALSLCLTSVSIFYILKSRGKRMLIASLLYLTLIACGYSMSYFSDIRNDKNWFGNNLHSVSLARITDAPVEKAKSWKVPVKIIYQSHDSTISRATGNAFLYLYKDDIPVLLHKGDSILIPEGWQPIKNAGNPFEFDYATYCRHNNLFYQHLCSPKNVRLYATNDPANAPILERTHDWCMQQLDDYVKEPKTKGLLQAMLLGDEINLDEELRQSYADTGIVHIIAISGGNVAIFFIVISFLLWWLKDRKYFWIRYAVALPLVWFYVLMAGAQPSAIRAAIMFSLLALGIILQKNNNSLNQLFATAFLLLGAQPMWLFSVGFQLSFVAVLSLILFYKHVYSWFSSGNRVVQLLWSTIAASIAAEVLIAPLVIYYFHTFPLLFIISNVLAYLFMGLVLVLSIAIIALSWLPAIAAALGSITISIVTVFDNLVIKLQNCNPNALHSLTLSDVELLLIYVAIAGIALLFVKKEKRALLVGISAICLAALFFCRDHWVTLHQQHFVVYNVPGINLIEIINGSSFTLFNKDSSDKTARALKPAHTFWHVSNEDTSLKSNIFQINNKKILILNADISTEKKLSVDYLVLNYTGATDLIKLQQAFSPEKIVIGNNYSGKELEALRKISSDNHIPIYIIADNGAFVR